MPAPGARAKAKAKGEPFYETGNPCKNGHVAPRRTGSGLCVECEKAWFKDNADHRRVYAREWQQSDARRTYMADYYQSNLERWKTRYKASPESIKARSAQRRREHPEKVYAAIKRWHQANPDAVRAFKRNNRAKRKAAPGRHTGEDIVALFNAQRGLCTYCSADLIQVGYHVDHDVPLVRGGSNDPSNLCLACPTCNMSKQDMTGAEFRLAKVA